jgi:nucleoside phosphorylase
MESPAQSENNTSRRVFLHYLNREVLIGYNALIPDYRELLRRTLLTTRYSLLISDLPLILSPKFAFEFPVFHRFVGALKAVSSAGLLNYSSENPDYTLELPGKQKQYYHQQNLFQTYFEDELIKDALSDLQSIPWEPGQFSTSTTQAIVNHWLAAVGSTGLQSIILESSGKSWSPDLLMDVPERLQGKAFIVSNVSDVLGDKFSPLQAKEINFLINSAYLRHYMKALKSDIMCDTPLGSLDYGLREHPEVSGRVLSFRKIREYMSVIGIAQSIENFLPWPDLIELRESLHFRWFKEKAIRYALDHDIIRSDIEYDFVLCGASDLIGGSPPESLDEIKKRLIKVLEVMQRANFEARDILNYDFSLSRAKWLQRRMRPSTAATEVRRMQLILPFDTADTDTLMKEQRQMTIAIITIRDDEFRSVLARFPERQHRRISRLYEVSKVSDELDVAIVRLDDQGNGAAADAARDIIADLSPTLIILVGIGGGLPSADYFLGDVIVATSVHDLRVRSIEEGGKQEFRSTAMKATKSLRDLIAQLPAYDGDIEGWNKKDALHAVRPKVEGGNKLKSSVYGSVAWRSSVVKAVTRHGLETGARTDPIVFQGAIASGDTLVKDTGFAADVKGFVRQIQAFEMEAAGVFDAADRHEKQYPVMVVRGISDIVGLKRDDGWTKYACETAASFVDAFIRANLARHL